MSKENLMINLFDQYKENGYVIFPKLISKAKIDSLLDELDEFKKNNLLYFSQSEHNYRRVKNDLDEFNLLNSSFHNFTDILWAYRFGKAGRDILQSSDIKNALSKLSYFKEFTMWQNMLFDKSTGTIDHIDAWYLDTNPPGSLLAVWVALEDIDGKGGSFHLYPKSHKNSSKSWIGLDHNQLIEWTKLNQKKYKKKNILLKKGDVLIWHPLLIHGSSSQKEPGFSRKSITAHYCPNELLMGGNGVSESIETTNYKKKLSIKKKNSRNFGYPVACRRSRKKIALASIYGFTRYLSNIGNSPFMLMNRKEYE